MMTKEQMTLSRSGERVKTSGHFYRRFREFGGCCTRAVTGSSGANGLNKLLFYYSFKIFLKIAEASESGRSCN